MKNRLVQALVLVALLAACSWSASAITLDIHIEFGDQAYFRELDRQIHLLLPNDEIDLVNTSMPHVTLYMTDFQNSKIPYIISETSRIVNAYAQACPIDLRGITVSGNYSMWDVHVTPCLQKWSDLLATQLSKYMVPDQPIPDWVQVLPEPLRTEKINMIKEYGSPNVFDQFGPHVTLAWDAIDKMEPAFQLLNIQPRIVPSHAVAVGSVGPHGTVQRGKNFGYYPLN